jgi:hypothetical protein
MKSLSLIVTAAMPLLLSIACNNRNAKAKLNENAKTHGTIYADTARSVGVAYEAPKVVADDELKEEAPPPDEGQQQSTDAGNGQRPVAPPLPTPPNPDWDRKIVKTANLALKVKNFNQFTGRLHAAVKQAGGYIAQEQLSQNAGEIDNTVTIKVPVDRFESLMGEMPGDSDKLEEKKIASEDVTMELVDTKSHLQTKKEVRERYLELLKQAHNMKDIIAIQNEIDGIQQEMDEATGRIAWLGHSSTYSTINLRFYQVLDERIREEPEPGFAHRLKDAIRDGWTGLSSLLLELISVWPLWLVLGFAVVSFRKWRIRTRAGVSAAQPAKEGV